MLDIVREFVDVLFPPKPKFDIYRDVPDLSDKVMIITGGTTAIGKETAKILLTHNAKVYLGARSKEKALKVINQLKESTGKEAIFLQMDLASLRSISRAVKEFKSKEPKLDVLYNSANVMSPPIELLTDEGYDLQFGANLLGHAHLTLSLMSELKEAARQSLDGKARVVNTLACGVYFADHIDYKAAEGHGGARRKLGKAALHAQSKLANLMFSRELAERYGADGIVSTSIYPGHIRSDTHGCSCGISDFLPCLVKTYPAKYAAITQVYAGTSVKGRDFNGQHLKPWDRLGSLKNMHPIARDPEEGATLWCWIDEQRRAQY